MGITEKDRKGSRYRCLLYSSILKEEGCKSLEMLCNLGDDFKIGEKQLIFPNGLENPKEMKLTNTKAKVIFQNHIQKITFMEFKKQVLNDWWLKHTKGANTPNWDFVSTCFIRDEPGLVLIEAKAHEFELSDEGKTLESTASSNSRDNHEKIGKAIAEANEQLSLAAQSKGFNISRDTCYQLSNRFAFSWKLASLGIPVVLIYLGFINAKEMGHKYFKNHNHWEKFLLSHSEGIIPKTVWNSNMLKINGVPVYPLIRSMDLKVNPEIREINGAVI